MNTTIKIVYTCPKCGHDLEENILTSNPPIYQKICKNCGWKYEEREQVIRMPFEESLMESQ